ncbi:MAG: N-acetyltransferase [Caulobacteraceae bacterium]|nr:MAG: N-acetyltransferase [Caulobacteraceae bacterium]
MEGRPPAIRLVGLHAVLEPLDDAHREALRTACDADQEIWQIYPYSMGGEHFDAFWKSVRARQESGALVPFAVLHVGKVVGISCLALDGRNRAVDIGGTYYHPEVRGTAVNPEAKRLLMAHAFDHGVRRVAFKVDAVNARSRAAVLKLGAIQEGILRADTLTWTGRMRDTVVFSVLADEWPAVRDRLDARLAAFA